MGTLLVRNAEVLVTMDEERREVADGALYARDGWIEAVGPTGELPRKADRVLDLSGHLVIPGLVNAHHHLYQTLTRAFPGAQDARLFPWLRALYPVWARLTPEQLRLSTQVGLAELALSGCTTAFDHLYLYPGGCRPDHQAEAARWVGLRFHVSRGSMSLGESEGGLPPDEVVEDEERILEDTRRVVEEHHDPSPGSMLQVVVAPCSPFSVSPGLMRRAAGLARSLGVRLHTHLAETLEEEGYCQERFGRRPVALAEKLGWLGEDVWLAHAVHLDPSEVGALAGTGTGVAHCPTSNMRLGSGAAPLRQLLAAGVAVGLGVDGSASNDGGDLLAEARQAMLVARLAAAADPDAALLSPRRALELATLGGAAVLGRDDVGSLQAGRCADFAGFSLDRLELAGALHDPVAALLLCQPVRPAHVYVHGRPVVEDGELTTLELPPLIEAHNRAARLLAG